MSGVSSRVVVEMRLRVLSEADVDVGVSIAGKHAYRFGYLKSEQWQTVRAEVLARDGAKCFLCDAFNLSNDVHHKEYPKNVWETQARHCITLCRKCHHKIHIAQKHGIIFTDSVLKRLRGHVRSKIAGVCT
jgi:hypothetical protein